MKRVKMVKMDEELHLRLKRLVLTPEVEQTTLESFLDTLVREALEARCARG